MTGRWFSPANSNTPRLQDQRRQQRPSIFERSLVVQSLRPAPHAVPNTIFRPRFITPLAPQMPQVYSRFEPLIALPFQQPYRAPSYIPFSRYQPTPLIPPVLRYQPPQPLLPRIHAPVRRAIQRYSIHVPPGQSVQQALRQAISQPAVRYRPPNRVQYAILQAQLAAPNLPPAPAPNNAAFAGQPPQALGGAGANIQAPIIDPNAQPQPGPAPAPDPVPVPNNVPNDGQPPQPPGGAGANIQAPIIDPNAQQQPDPAPADPVPVPNNVPNDGQPPQPPGGAGANIQAPVIDPNAHQQPGPAPVPNFVIPQIIIHAAEDEAAQNGNDDLPLEEGDLERLFYQDEVVAPPQPAPDVPPIDPNIPMDQGAVGGVVTSPGDASRQLGSRHLSRLTNLEQAITEHRRDTTLSAQERASRSAELEQERLQLVRDMQRNVNEQTQELNTITATIYARGNDYIFANLDNSVDEATRSRIIVRGLPQRITWRNLTELVERLESLLDKLEEDLNRAATLRVEAESPPPRAPVFPRPPSPPPPAQAMVAQGELFIDDDLLAAGGAVGGIDISDDLNPVDLSVNEQIILNQQQEQRLDTLLESLIALNRELDSEQDIDRADFERRLDSLSEAQQRLVTETSANYQELERKIHDVREVQELLRPEFFARMIDMQIPPNLRERIYIRGLRVDLTWRHLWDLKSLLNRLADQAEENYQKAKDLIPPAKIDLTTLTTEDYLQMAEGKFQQLSDEIQNIQLRLSIMTESADMDSTTQRDIINELHERGTQLTRTMNSIMSRLDMQRSAYPEDHPLHVRLISSLLSFDGLNQNLRAMLPDREDPLEEGQELSVRLRFEGSLDREFLGQDIIFPARHSAADSEQASTSDTAKEGKKRKKLRFSTTVRVKPFYKDDTESPDGDPGEDGDAPGPDDDDTKL